jgi:putative addiction module killer protein
VGYTGLVVEIRRTSAFDKWLRKLRDAQAKAKVLVRIQRLALGNPGDVKPVGEGISEMRIDYGPGYRVYYTQRGSEVIVLLVGGDKSSQESDIARAMELAKGLEG